MDFGICGRCDTYKYLADSGDCPTCTDDPDDWIVIAHTPHMSGGFDIVEEDLTETEARRRASGDPRYLARHESVL